MTAQVENYPRDCWWVAAKAEEVTDKPLARWLLDEPVVMFRKSDGTIAALEDRCPHRWAPLSLGEVIDDTLVCGYHGFRFDCSGACVKIPTQDKIPERAKVRAYPIVEQDRFVWIWMGDASLAGPAEIPRLAYMSDPEWNSYGDYMELGANYFYLQENVLDLTHFAFAHAKTLLAEGWDNADDEISIEPDSVGFIRTIHDVPIPAYLWATGIDREIRTSYSTFGRIELPGVHKAGSDVTDPATGKQFNWRISHLTTPQSATKTHYWWIVGQNFGYEGAPEHLAVREVIIRAFNEDKTILEAIQQMVERDPRGMNAPEISVVADRSALQARRILKARLDADTSA